MENEEDYIVGTIVERFVAGQQHKGKPLLRLLNNTNFFYII